MFCIAEISARGKEAIGPSQGNCVTSIIHSVYSCNQTVIQFALHSQNKCANLALPICLIPYQLNLKPCSDEFIRSARHHKITNHSQKCIVASAVQLDVTENLSKF